VKRPRLLFYTALHRVEALQSKKGFASRVHSKFSHFSAFPKKKKKKKKTVATFAPPFVHVCFAVVYSRTRRARQHITLRRQASPFSLWRFRCLWSRTSVARDVRQRPARWCPHLACSRSLSLSARLDWPVLLCGSTRFTCLLCLFSVVFGDRCCTRAQRTWRVDGSRHFVSLCSSSKLSLSVMRAWAQVSLRWISATHTQPSRKLVGLRSAYTCWPPRWRGKEKEHHYRKLSSRSNRSNPMQNSPRILWQPCASSQTWIALRSEFPLNWTQFYKLPSQVLK